MGVEVILNIGLGSYIHVVQLALPCQESTRILRFQARGHQPVGDNEASIPVRGRFPK